MSSSPSKTNEIKANKFSAWKVLFRQFKNPLLLVFIIATIVAFAVGEKTEALVIWTVMALSIILGFVNEYQAERVVNDLIKRITFNVTVIRNGIKQEISAKDIRVGDEVSLHPGSIIPADIKLTLSESLEINESVLTGESLPVIKHDGDVVYMGTVVTGGNGHGIVTAIGMDTKFGKISLLTSSVKPQTEFQKGLREFSSLLTKVAGIMVFLVIGLGFLLHHPLIDTILFALTIAIGITPELLPLIVSLSLSYGAKKLAKKDVIVKQFVSIEDLGNMEVLCTDKTGTLTEGKISLTSYQNINGDKDDLVIRHSLLCNSGYLHGHVVADSIDRAIIDFAEANKIKLEDKPKELFELPFDYENRFMSMVVKDGEAALVICKGSPESILVRSNLTESENKKQEKLIEDLQNDGLRVIAVASKKIKEFDPKLVKTEFNNLNFEGLICFADVPKKDLKESLEKFEKLGVSIKIITGDNELVAGKIARDVGFSIKKILLSHQIEKMNDEELETKVWETDIFARVTPSQKDRIIKALKHGGHTVGYLGDGVNDGPALHMADVGISVNTGVDVAKDAASIVLLKKSLGVIADGITEGRVTFNNTIKYVLMGTSSDFGNMISAAAASVFLPFLPMTPAQILLTNIMYDVSQLTIPSDNVDSDQIVRPKNWDINYIKRFMLVFGPISTAYDFLTFGIMYFIFKARGGLFQTGWFVESMITEILVVFVIRTTKIPFWKSKPGKFLSIACLGVVFLSLYLPFSPLRFYFGFTPLPSIYFLFLIIIAVTYLILVEIGKYFLNKHAINRTKS
jgi:Mg2+-importing ATPase